MSGKRHTLTVSVTLTESGTDAPASAAIKATMDKLAYAAGAALSEMAIPTIASAVLNSGPGAALIEAACNIKSTAQTLDITDAEVSADVERAKATALRVHAFTTPADGRASADDTPSVH